MCEGDGRGAGTGGGGGRVQVKVVEEGRGWKGAWKGRVVVAGVWRPGTLLGGGE